LPKLEICDYIKQDNDKFELEITPNYGFKISEKYLEENEEAFNEYENAFILDEDEIKSNNLLKSLLSCLNKYFTTDKMTNFSMNPENRFSIKEVELSKDLVDVDSSKLQKIAEVYFELNKHTVSYFNLMRELFFSKEIAQNKENYKFRKEFLLRCIKKGSLENSLILAKLFAFKDSIFSCSKDFILKRILDDLPAKGRYEDIPTVEYDRPTIMEKRDTGEVDHQGMWTMFGLTMQKCKKLNYQNLLLRDDEQRPWSAKFISEGSIDQGGPFRDSIENIVDELHSKNLPLLIPTQNNKHQHGVGQDLWILNPSATSPSHLEMFKFLGALMAMGLRSGHNIMLRLPSLFWKNFMGEEVTIEDLEEIDAYAVQGIHELETIKSW
jgi:hypothetical protein